LNSQFLPSDAVELAPESVIRARADRLATYLADVADQRVEWDVPAAVTGARLSASERESLRERWLVRLRNEFVVSNPTQAVGVLEGKEPLPDAWLTQRIMQLGLNELFDKEPEA
jgi:hypothetical protein